MATIKVSKSKITIKIKRDGNIFDEKLARMRKPQPVLDKIGELMVKANRQRMNEKVDPQGNPWQPITKESRKRRVRPAARRNNKILYDTKHLVEGVSTYTVQKKKRKHRLYEVHIKTDKKLSPYAGVHQTYLYPNANIPLTRPRKFLGHAKGELKQYRRMMINYLEYGKL